MTMTDYSKLTFTNIGKIEDMGKVVKPTPEGHTVHNLTCNGWKVEIISDNDWFTISMETRYGKPWMLTHDQQYTLSGDASKILECILENCT